MPNGAKLAKEDIVHAICDDTSSGETLFSSGLSETNSKPISHGFQITTPCSQAHIKVFLNSMVLDICGNDPFAALPYVESWSTDVDVPPPRPREKKRGQVDAMVLDREMHLSVFFAMVGLWWDGSRYECVFELGWCSSVMV